MEVLEKRKLPPYTRTEERLRWWNDVGLNARPTIDLIDLSIPRRGISFETALAFPRDDGIHLEHLRISGDGWIVFIKGSTMVPEVQREEIRPNVLYTLDLTYDMPRVTRVNTGIIRKRKVHPDQSRLYNYFPL